MNQTIAMLIRIISNIQNYRLPNEIAYEGERKRKLYVALGKICEALDILFELEKTNPD